MRALGPIRRFAWSFVFMAVYVAVFLSGFWIDVPPVQRTAGLTLSALMVGVFAYVTFAPRGQEAVLRPVERRDLSDPGEQWRAFFHVLGVLVVMMTVLNLELSPWTFAAIAVPLMALTNSGVVVGERLWSRRRASTSDQA